MSETDENKRNRLILIALADVYEIPNGENQFNDAFKAASKLKAEADSGILVYYKDKKETEK